jgi:hypothetical protein
MSDENYPEQAAPVSVEEILDRELKRFKQRFAELMDELADTEYPMTDNDLVLFRERLLDLPGNQRGADTLGTVREEALDDPDKLRQLYQVTLRTRDAIDRMNHDAGYSSDA